MGGRGQNSSIAKTNWSNRYDQRFVNVMSKLGVSERIYKDNTSVGNRLYMNIMGEISSNYEKETGIRDFGTTKEFENYVKNYNINDYVKKNKIAKEYLAKLRTSKRK